jgi:hypothetical protein
MVYMIHLSCGVIMNRLRQPGSHSILFFKMDKVELGDSLKNSREKMRCNSVDPIPR